MSCAAEFHYDLDRGLEDALDLTEKDVHPIRDYEAIPRGLLKVDQTVAEIPTLLFYGEDGSVEWGYPAEKFDPSKNKKKRSELPPGIMVVRFKSLLDDSVEPKYKEPLLKILERAGKSEQDVLVDWFTCWLRHIKKYLRDNYQYSDRDVIRLVFAVPVMYSATSKMNMEKAILTAAKRVELGKLEPIEIYSEPDAAVAFFIDYKMGRLFKVRNFVDGTYETNSHHNHIPGWRNIHPS